MSKPLLVSIVALALIGVFLLLRAMLKRHSGGYRSRFSPRHTFTNQAASNDDVAFPIASTLFVGDGGSHAHVHTHHHADCGHHVDAGAGCSDGGGGSH